MTKLLALGDIHLGAGAALGREPGSRLRDQNDVLDRILGVACKREVDALLVAGDVFEGPVVTPEQMDVFARFIDDAAEDGIPVVAVSGNGTHDQAMRTVNGLAIFDRLPGITVYSRPAVHDLGEIQVACLPWVSPARLVASMDGDVDRDRVNARAAELLVKVADGIADPRVKPTVLMLHGSISGASLPAGISTDDLREPVIDLDALLGLGYSAVVAGHIHVSQCVCSTALGLTWQQPAGGESYGAAALYTGSPMPLNFGERDTAHGCWILDVDTDGTRAEFVPIESRPLRQTVFDIAGVPVDEFVDSIYDPAAWPDVDEAIVKVTLRCTQAQQRRLDLARLREAVLAAGAHTVKVETDVVREQRSRVAGVTGEIGPLAAFDMWASVNPLDPDLATSVREQLRHDLETVGA